MKEKITYIAIDGKEFDDFEACAGYEFKTLYEQYSQNLIFYDEKFNVIDKNAYDAIDKSSYIYLKDDEAVKACMLLYEQYGYILPDHIGYFEYDWEKDDWISLTKNLAHFYSRLKETKEKINVMGGNIK